jgi:hypothetical protein
MSPGTEPDATALILVRRVGQVAPGVNLADYVVELGTCSDCGADVWVSAASLVAPQALGLEPRLLCDPCSGSLEAPPRDVPCIVRHTMMPDG